MTAPFFASDAGDVDVFPTLDDMASHVEVYDLATYEFFDADGGSIRATSDRYDISLVPDPETPARPERLEELLRGFFARLPAQLGDYSQAAAQATSLSELVRLRTRLAGQTGDRTLDM